MFDLFSYLFFCYLLIVDCLGFVAIFMFAY